MSERQIKGKKMQFSQEQLRIICCSQNCKKKRVAEVFVSTLFSTPGNSFSGHCCVFQCLQDEALTGGVRTLNLEK